MGFLALNEVSTDRFTYNAGTKTFVAEASDLPRGWSLQSRIWDDACDVGFELVNPRTGGKVKFFLSDRKFDREGDLQYETYLPISDELYRNPALKGMKVVVYND